MAILRQSALCRENFQPYIDVIDAHALNGVVLCLYREGREVPLASFQTWALEQIQSLIAFDSAWWGNAAEIPPVLHEMHLHNCDPSIRDAYPPFRKQDVFRAALIARPGTTINLSDLCPRELHVRTPLYREFGCRFKMECVLGTLLTEPISSLYEFLTLWRHDPRCPFTEADRQAKELLMPHLVETHRAARLRHFLKVPASHKRLWALIDDHGFLREASPAFVAYLSANWPDWSGSSLPEVLASSVKAGRVFSSAAIHFDITSCGPLRCMFGRSDGALEHLSERERGIAVLYVKGESYSEIAASLSLSPATVRNHIAHCFHKLRVNNKLELLRRMESNP